MVRGVGVLWRSEDGCVAVIKECGGCYLVESDGADFLAQHTLLQVCRPVTTVLDKGTTIIAW